MVAESLAKPEILDLLNKNVYRLFMDIDYTVLDFEDGHMAAINEIGKTYSTELAREMDATFRLILKSVRNPDILDKSEQEEFSKLKEMVGGLLTNVNEFGIKLWARELWVVNYANKFKVEMKPETVTEIVDLYWKKISENSRYYDDALVFLNLAKKNEIPIVWVTGSDSRVKVRKDNNVWHLTYSPEHSRAFKENRLKKLLTDFPGEIITGDPVDKPEIWSSILEKYFAGDVSKSVAVGDSYHGDVMPAEKFGATGILIKRG